MLFAVHVLNFFSEKLTNDEIETLYDSNSLCKIVTDAKWKINKIEIWQFCFFYFSNKLHLPKAVFPNPFDLRHNKKYKRKNFTANI
jgi:hypothetical protein